jgi:hypothetical protein
VDTESRKIGLSLRRVQWAAEDHQKKVEESGHAHYERPKDPSPRRGGLDGTLMPMPTYVPNPIANQEQKS